MKEVERLTSLTIGDKTLEVEYYLGGGDPQHGALTTEENIHTDQSRKKHWLQCFSLPNSMAYSSTPYVEMAPKKNGGHIKSA